MPNPHQGNNVSDDSDTDISTDSDMDQTLENESPQHKSQTVSHTVDHTQSLRTLHRKVISLDSRTPNKGILQEDSEESEDDDMDTPKASQATSKFSSSNGDINSNSSSGVNRNQNAHPGSSISPPKSTDSELLTMSNTNSKMSNRESERNMISSGDIVEESEESEEEDEDIDFGDEDAWDDSTTEDVLSKPVATVVAGKHKSAITKEKGMEKDVPRDSYL